MATLSSAGACDLPDHPAFPQEELYGLTAQSRRAAFSAANVVEGSAKRGGREFGRFLDIAIGSLAELSYTLRLARELDYIPASEADRIEQLREQSSKAVWGLYESLRRPRSGDCR